MQRLHNLRLLDGQRLRLLFLQLLSLMLIISRACHHIPERGLLMNSHIFIVARHRIVPFRQREHLQTPRLIILLNHLGLPVDVLEGEFGDVNLFLLLLLRSFVEEDLMGALVAGLEE